MNNLISSTQSDNYQSDFGYSNQSIFLLPLLFAVIMIVFPISKTIYDSITQNYIYDNYGVLITFNNLSSNILHRPIMFFIISVFMFIEQRIHRLTLNTLAIMLISCVIYHSINFIIMNGFQQIMHLLSESDSFDKLNKFTKFCYWFLSFFYPIILIIILKLIGNLGKKERAPYFLSLGIYKSLFATLFTLIFLFPVVMFIFPIAKSSLLSFIINTMYLTAKPNETTIFFGIIPSFVIFISFIINFFIIYFSVKNCFIRETDTLSLKSLFKSVGWAYLYLFGLAVIIGIVYVVIAMLLSANIRGYSQRDSLIFLIMLMNFVVTIINIIAVIIFTRKAVRKYFS